MLEEHNDDIYTNCVRVETKFCSGSVNWHLVAQVKLVQWHFRELLGLNYCPIILNYPLMYFHDEKASQIVYRDMKRNN